MMVGVLDALYGEGASAILDAALDGPLEDLSGKWRPARRMAL